MPLSQIEANSAASYNRGRARSVGWASHYPRIAYLFGLQNMSVSATGFSQAVADWQGAQRPRLTVDGKIGPNTWRALHTQLDREVNFTPNIPPPVWLTGGGSGPGPSIGPAPVSGSGPRWMQVAQAEQIRWNTLRAGLTGDARNHAEGEVDWDEKYFVAASMWGGRTHAPGEIPEVNSTSFNWMWCAAFVNYCLHRAGFSHTGSAGAGSFLRRGNWRFEALAEPRVGCVAVIGSGSSPSHVAFLASTRGLPRNPGHSLNGTSHPVRLLGGNQGNRVGVLTYSRNLLAATDRRGRTSPYLWPEVGTGNCTVPLATEQSHFCRYRPT